MSKLRHIFSFKLVLVFAVVTFLGAAPKPADAGGRAKCPCLFAASYASTTLQDKIYNFHNRIQECVRLDGNVAALQGQTPNPPDTTCFVRFLAVPPGTIGDSNACAWSIFCSGGVDQYEYVGQSTDLTDDQLAACQKDLTVIAKLLRLLPACN
jgi:hypothetical protein